MNHNEVLMEYKYMQKTLTQALTTLSVFYDSAWRIVCVVAAATLWLTFLHSCLSFPEDFLIKEPLACL